jgi:hypothetical protein
MPREIRCLVVYLVATVSGAAASYAVTKSLALDMTRAFPLAVATGLAAYWAADLVIDALGWRSR